MRSVQPLALAALLAIKAQACIRVGGIVDIDKATGNGQLTSGEIFDDKFMQSNYSAEINNWKWNGKADYKGSTYYFDLAMTNPATNGGETKTTGTLSRPDTFAEEKILSDISGGRYAPDGQYNEDHVQRWFCVVDGGNCEAYLGKQASPCTLDPEALPEPPSAA